MHASHATLLAVLLLATSTDDAAAQQNTGATQERHVAYKDPPTLPCVCYHHAAVLVADIRA